MPDAVFVDTNLLVYARDASEGLKQRRANDWMRFLWESGTGRLSMQVLNEFYHIVTSKLDPGLPVDLARADVRDLMSWKPVGVDATTISRAWEIQDRFMFSWWDSLIVASAGQAGCSRLLTEDLQDGQDLGGIVVVDPFVGPPR